MGTTYTSPIENGSGMNFETANNYATTLNMVRECVNNGQPVSLVVSPKPKPKRFSEISAFLREAAVIDPYRKNEPKEELPLFTRLPNGIKRMYGLTSPEEGAQIAAPNLSTEPSVQKLYLKLGLKPYSPELGRYTEGLEVSVNGDALTEPSNIPGFMELGAEHTKKFIDDLGIVGIDDGAFIIDGVLLGNEAPTILQ